MRYRALSPSGDYVIGQGSANFYINDPQAVGQSVETRLLLWEGEWFLDTTVGMPWAQEVLGYNTGLYDTVIKSYILATVGVTSIESYSSTLDPETRQLTISGTVQTEYSSQPQPFEVVL